MTEKETNRRGVIVVENVVDAYRWGADDDGGLFVAWRQALTCLGYESEIVWLNSMFCPPTPQSRDRMYIVFWRKGVRKPNLRVEPPSWCVACEKVVAGRQAWKRPERPLETREGKPVGARYGAQYLYTCPDCNGVVLPGAFPATTALDWALPTPLIGERTKDLAVNTRERIRRGLERLAREPFAIRLLQGGVPRPLTLPLITLTQRHDVAMVLPVAGNTFERTPGNRARRGDLQPMDTVAATDPPGCRGLVVPNRAHNTPRLAELEPSAPILTGGTVALVRLRRNGDSRAIHEPVHTVSAGGQHHGLVVRNFSSESETGWECTPAERVPVHTLTGRCHQSLIVPYQSAPHAVTEPVKTVMTRDRLALVVPPMAGAAGEREIGDV